MVLVGIGVTWNQLSKRSQQKVKRKLDDAVKMAQGAYEAARGADTQPVLKKGETPAAKKGEPPVAKKTEPTPTATPTPTPTPTPQTPTPQTATPQTPTPPSPEPIAAKKEAPLPPPPPQPPEQQAKKEEPPQQAQQAELPDDDDDDTVEEPVAPSDTPGAKLEQAVEQAAPPPAPTPTPAGRAKAKLPTTQDAQKLIAANRFDEAIKMLYEVRRHAPKSATVALLLGHAYFHKLWRTDGLREYDTAIKLSPMVRRNLMLVRNTVAALDDPTIASRAR